MNFNLIGFEIHTSCGYHIDSLQDANQFAFWKQNNRFLQNHTVEDLQICERWYSLLKSEGFIDVADATFDNVANLLDLLTFVAYRDYRNSGDVEKHKLYILYYIHKQKQIVGAL